MESVASTGAGPCRRAKLGVMWKPPDPALRKDDVTLRPFRTGDAAALVAACRDQDMLRFTLMQDGFAEPDAVDWIARANERWPQGKTRFAVVDSVDDQLRGQVGVGVNPDQPSAEGYYRVSSHERGRGVASRALGLVADWVFANGVERLFLLIHPENVASNRLAARVGFSREGVLRAYKPFKGRRPDLVEGSPVSLARRQATLALIVNARYAVSVIAGLARRRNEGRLALRGEAVLARSGS